MDRRPGPPSETVFPPAAGPDPSPAPSLSASTVRSGVPSGRARVPSPTGRPAARRGRIVWSLAAVSLAAVTAGAGVAAFTCGARCVAAVPGGTEIGRSIREWSADPPLGAADGVVPDGGRLSPFDAGQPAVANLDPELLRAVRRAAKDAAREGVGVFLTTGWRSRAYQRRLLDEAIAKYGSEREAARYVATPERSRHVTGHAVDIGPTDADDWLSRHGARYGLCQMFANEMWHFELATTPGGTCPEMRPDAAGG
ncbi:M15 family metallopeptidase [Sphaerisporangium sp. NPDC005289]|uniref:M15 family metallopeptidase n=1 Tax=Sphaerisporangium sp. NPDC005289 TaxID=3155247 RepID=UPI0033A3C50F